MGKDVYINDSDTWKSIIEAYGRVSGVWKIITKGWVNVSGTWKEHYNRAGDVYPITIDNSIWVDGTADYMTRTQQSTITNNKKSTVSVWVKRCELGRIQTILCGYIDGNNVKYLAFDANDKLHLYYAYSNTDYSKLSTEVFRDVGGWYHIVVAYDSTDATAGDRTKIWVNGVEIELTGTDVPQDTPDYFNYASITQEVGRHTGAGYYYNGYLAELILVDGSVLTADDFGELSSGIWVYNPGSLTYGNNGFYLDFADASDLGDDESGNGNDYTETSIDSDNQSADSPTDNYAVLSSIQVGLHSYDVISEGGLTGTYGGANSIAVSTLPFDIEDTEGYYCEMTVGTLGVITVGIHGLDETSLSIVTAYMYYRGGQIYTQNSPSAYGDSYTAGDVIGVAAKNGKVWFAINNVWQNSGNPVTEANPAWSGLEGLFYFFKGSAGSASNSGRFNFGQEGFTYTPPSGFKELKCSNLDEPAILESDTGFNLGVYTGNNTDDRQIDTVIDPTASGALAWFKCYSHAISNNLWDTEREATNLIKSDSSAAELTLTNELKAFNSSGLLLGTSSAVNALTNYGARDYVYWLWKKGAAYGFDIVEYTGTGVAKTEAHSLGVKPDLIIVKNLGASENWCVYGNVTGMGATNLMYLNLTSVAGASSTIWNDTEPSASVFTIGTNTKVNQNTKDFIAYLFASIPGYSKIGVYTGNGVANGPFVYCGFRPAFVVSKGISAGYGWHTYDAVRSPYNVVNDRLYLNTTSAEAVETTNIIDFLSNGFKIRASGGGINGSSQTYLYMAFAEQPGKYANAR
jgi:hypothetical protein